jgi:hypothetical protein
LVTEPQVTEPAEPDKESSYHSSEPEPEKPDPFANAVRVYDNPLARAADKTFEELKFKLKRQGDVDP